jgi:hypothetical protein
MTFSVAGRRLLAKHTHRESLASPANAAFVWKTFQPSWNIHRDDACAGEKLANSLPRPRLTVETGLWTLTEFRQLTGQNTVGYT